MPTPLARKIKAGTVWINYYGVYRSYLAVWRLQAVRLWQGTGQAFDQDLYTQIKSVYAKIG